MSDLNETWIFSTGFIKLLKFNENPSSGTEMYQADERTDERTDGQTDGQTRQS